MPVFSGVVASAFSARITLTLPVLLLALSCGSPADGDAARIVVGRADDGSGNWEATYYLGEPMTELHFSRPAQFYREEVWEIMTPGWSFQRGEGGQQLLVYDASESGAEGSAELQVRFPVHTENIIKEYELFGAFTDGSLALYTGHLYVAPTGDDTVVLDQLELVPEAGENLVIQGEVFRGRTIWEDPHGDGTYAYFGPIPPLETDSMIAIVDPGAPGWLVEQLNRMLPEFFDRYTERFDEALPWKPVVLFSFHDVDRPGLSSGGGTLTGLIQMSATGKDWHNATPTSSELLLHLIAHEAAHLWNGQLHTYDEMADSWMHEGSADALADLLLLESGAIDEERLAGRRTDALNHCARGLREGSLSTALDRNQFQTYYKCGNMIALWSIAARSGTSQGDASRQLFSLWRTLYATSNEDDGSYNRQSYFDALQTLGATEEQVASLQAFLDTEFDDPAAALIDFLASAEVKLTVAERPDESMRRDSSRASLQHLMSGTCQGQVSFRSEGDWIRTFPIDGCAAFAEEWQVTQIAGHSVATDGDRALASTIAGCRDRGSVSLTLIDETTRRIPCATPPRNDPRPLLFPVL